MIDLDFVIIWIVAIPSLLMTMSFFLWRLFVQGEKNRRMTAAACMQCGSPMMFKNRCDNCGQYFR